MSNTNYHFLSSLRQGLAASIQSIPKKGNRAEIDVSLHVSRRKLSSGEWDSTLAPIDRTVQLYGPGDIAAFDERMIVRMEPKPDSGNFEPNYFPAVEFADPDFPWRFSPEPTAASGSSKPDNVIALTPWISLIALIAEDSGEDIRKEFEELPRGKNQMPAIQVFSQLNLPDLSNAWRWAHVQTTMGTANLTGITDDERNNLNDKQKRASVADKIEETLASRPELVVSRLLCTRRLLPKTLYRVFIVPTYKLGWAAALDTPKAHDKAKNCKPIDLAWVKTNDNDGEITLPFFYQWDFRTSLRGDFESLVRLLEKRSLDGLGLGLSDIDCEQPGFGLTVEHTKVDDEQTGEQTHLLSMEGALQSLGTKYTHWGKDKTEQIKDGQSPEPEEFQTRLAKEVLNKATVKPVVILSAGFGEGLLSDLSFNVQPDGKSVEITWNASNNTTCIIDYGPENDMEEYPCSASGTSGTSHKRTIELIPEKTYDFRIRFLNGNEETTNKAKIRVPLPAVVPPIYGRWHAAQDNVSAAKEKNAWIDVLNLDPRHRSAAGLGATVVQNQQEALMGSAWDQIGAIEAANDILRRAQLGREGSNFLHKRFAYMALEDFIRNTTPAQKRVLIEGSNGTKQTVSAMLKNETRIPPAATDPAFRRITRARGPIRKRQKKRPMDMLRRLASGDLQPAGQHPKIEGTITPCDITQKMLVPSVELDAEVMSTTGKGDELSLELKLDWKSTNVNQKLVADNKCWFGEKEPKGTETIKKKYPWVFSLTADTPAAIVTTLIIVKYNEHTKETMVNKSVETKLKKLDDSAKRFCEKQITVSQVKDSIKDGIEGIDSEDKSTIAVINALDIFQNFTDHVDEKPTQPPKYFDSVKTHVQSALSPQLTIKERVKRRLRFRGELGKRFEPDATGDPFDEIMAYPEFPQPMYESLRDVSQSLILPGVEKIPQNTVGLLETNRRFLESYMVGLNHEFASELLWRRYPTDQRGTCFRQFWNVDEYVGDSNDDPLLSEIDEAGNLKAEVKEALKDIRPLHKWDDSCLGYNDNSKDDGKRASLVLIVRGDLLKRYPNAIVYAIDAYEEAGELMPNLPEFKNDTNCKPVFPIFRGSLGADLVFMGFPFDKESARSKKKTDEDKFTQTGKFFSFPFDKDSARSKKKTDEDKFTQTGKFFVLEERVSEARFGLDSAESDEESGACIDWNNLNWGHFQLAKPESVENARFLDSATEISGCDGETWDESTDAALRARITLQKPARLAVHADQMLPVADED